MPSTDKPYTPYFLRLADARRALARLPKASGEDDLAASLEAEGFVLREDDRFVLRAEAEIHRLKRLLAEAKVGEA